MPNSSIVSPEDQTVTFVELFFDLVFVFSVTQVVSFFHHGVSWSTAGSAVLVFWLVWWAWTQFTWALNAANTDHQHIQIAMLLATAIAFFMAIAVPDAFGNKALWFAIPYVMVRLVGLHVYTKVTVTNERQYKGVRSFALASIGGLTAVVIGAVLGGPTQYWLWGLAILLDALAAQVAGKSDSWNLHPEHFVERHGLIVIIALGESLIVAAAGLVGSDLTLTLLTVGLLAVMITCALWWSYFPYVKPLLESGLIRTEASDEGPMARDAFSFGHFPLLCGIIAISSAIEVAVLDPTAPLPLKVRVAMASGLFLFTVAAAYAQWRTVGILPRMRLFVIVVTGATIVLVAGTLPWVTLLIAFVGVTGVVIVEYVKCRPVVEHMIG